MGKGGEKKFDILVLGATGFTGHLFHFLNTILFGKINLKTTKKKREPYLRLSCQKLQRSCVGDSRKIQREAREDSREFESKIVCKAFVLKAFFPL